MHFSKMHFSKMHFLKILQIFGGLVLGCIKTKFCKKICVWQHFSSSTRFAYFCTAAISQFSQKIDLKNQQFSWKFSKTFANVAKFASFCQNSKISVRQSGRFWKMLQNAYLVAKIGADTAENEREFGENLPNFGHDLGGHSGGRLEFCAAGRAMPRRTATAPSAHSAMLEEDGGLEERRAVLMTLGGAKLAKCALKKNKIL